VAALTSRENALYLLQLYTLKPRPNDDNISTQHIATLLAQHLQVPAKRSQYFSTTYRNIVGSNILRAFCHPVATCWVLKIELVRMSGCNIFARTWPNDYTTTTSCNIHQCCMKNLTSVKFKPTTPNMSQHVTTGLTNARNMLRPTMLRYVGSCVEMLRSFGRGSTNYKHDLLQRSLFVRVRSIPCQQPLLR